MVFNIDCDISVFSDKSLISSTYEFSPCDISATKAPRRLSGSLPVALRSPFVAGGWILTGWKKTYIALVAYVASCGGEGGLHG